MVTNIFYDAEFTGLHQNSSLISIGLITEQGQQFYAEFSDYNRSQLDGWLQANVLPYCRWLSMSSPPSEVIIERQPAHWCCFGSRQEVSKLLAEWLAQFEAVQIWADCHAYDWVLFCELFGGSQHLPQQVSYMALDITTLFAAAGLSPQTDRQQYAQMRIKQHNALQDAQLAMACYQKLQTMLPKLLKDADAHPSSHEVTP